MDAVRATRAQQAEHEGRGVEVASAARSAPFPREWGVPPAGEFSEERAAWVRARVAEHVALQEQRRQAGNAAAGMRSAAGGAHARRMRALHMKRRFAPCDM
ncbi:hypothetical protein GCM10022214_74230 [Actinomadura miaoliensis]|uniref:Uncharacterized protein n=1 Tax=Actinomadura miaoliensis TaxID=430685 RepID=A0ABP7WWL5_9ACTN